MIYQILHVCDLFVLVTLLRTTYRLHKTYKQRKRDKDEYKEYVAKGKAAIDKLVADSTATVGRMNESRKTELDIVHRAIQREDRAKRALSAALLAVHASGESIEDVLAVVDAELKDNGKH